MVERMLPVHLAANIRKQVLYYLQSTFSFRDKRVARAFEGFLEDPDTGLFKGPWVQLRRPFRPAPEGALIPFEIRVPFQPFRHQWRAWMRLSSWDQWPQPTIITTGTGSGKTECFLTAFSTTADEHGCPARKELRLLSSIP